jgi:hypothetical protein
VTVVLFAGRYEIAIDTNASDPIPLAWDMDGRPIYKRDPLVEFDIETSNEEE